jgi:flagellar hook-associated protein 2
MAVERKSLLRLTTKQSKFKQERDAFNDINTRLSSLNEKLSPLLTFSSSSVFQKVSATSANASIVTATATNKATAATYDVAVKHLALSESAISKKDPTVAGFTSSVAGSDLDALIEASTTRLSSLHRRDNAANFADADLGELLIDDGLTGPIAVDLSAGLTEGSTVQDMIDHVNGVLAGAGSSVTVSLNAAENGLAFASGSGDISIADGGDGKTTATKFGVETAGLVAAPVDSGDLDADIQANTSLARLNGGAGIPGLANGLKIRHGSTTKTIGLSTATTVSDVLTAINGAGASVSASIDGAKKGLAITGTVGNKSLSIEENGGAAAAQLGIFGESHVLRMKTAADAEHMKVFLDGGYDGTSGDLSIADIRQSINAVSGRTFSSSVVDGRLTIQANKIGTENALQFKDNDPDNGVLQQLGILIADNLDDSTIANDFAGDDSLGGYLQAARDAVFSLNGVTVTRSKNTGIDDVISGVTLNLTGPSASTGASFPSDYAKTTLTIKTDSDSMANSIEEFVNQYNSVIDLLASQTRVNPTGDDGTLATNSIARNLQSQLFAAASRRESNSDLTYRSLFDLKDENGTFVFKVSNRGGGKIEMNKSALKNVLAKDPEGVAKLLRYDNDGNGTTDGGILHGINNVVTNYNRSNTGLIAGQIKTYELQISDIDKNLERTSELLQKKDAAIKRQFSSAEQLLSSMMNQSNYLSSQMAGLSRK